MNDKKETALPRVLIVSVSGWSDSVGSDTMSTLFSQYEKDKLASLYVRAELSDSPVCQRYFHILEGRIIKSLWNRKIKTGEAYHYDTLAKGKSDSVELSQERALYSKFHKYRPWSLIILRELIWKFGRWKTKELNDFLDDFKPEAVFFPIECYIHLDRIIEYIIDYCKPRKVICNLWDDNFTYKQKPYSLGYRIHRFWLRKHCYKLVEKGNVFICQNQKMQREFKEVFGKDSILLTKPIYDINVFHPYQPSKPIRLLYTGSLYINRDKTIYTLCELINKLNKNEERISLEVFSGTHLTPKLLEKIERNKGCYFRGHIMQSEVFEKQKEADVLLFVEDLSNKNLSARLSFSTKITDYLKAGKCVLAIGNKDLAPIEYFKEQQAGIVCNNKEEIYESLQRMVSDDSYIPSFAKAAYDCGVKNHDGNRIIQQLYKLIQE